MAESRFNVVVAKDLEDLVPVFMGNRRKEVDTLRAATAAADFEQLRQIGHRMKGVGNSYGFEYVSTLGKEIEDAGKAQNVPAAEACIAAYVEYLEKVEIAYE